MTFFAISLQVLVCIALAAVVTYARALSKPYGKVRYFIDNTLIPIFTIAAILFFLGLIIYLATTQ